MAKRSKTHVKKGDTVEVIAGSEKGKRGKILRILKDQNRVIVEKINMVETAYQAHSDESTGRHHRARGKDSHQQRDAR